MQQLRPKLQANNWKLKLNKRGIFILNKANKWNESTTRTITPIT